MKSAAKQKAAWLAGAVVGVALGWPVALHAQATDDLFAGVERFSQGASESSEVNLDRAALGLAGGPLDGKLDLVSVHDYEYAKPGGYKLADLEQFRKRLDGSGCKHIVRDQTATEVSDICVKVDSEGLWTDLVVLDAEPKELSFVHLHGRGLRLSDLSALGSLGGAAGKPDPRLQHRPSAP